MRRRREDNDLYSSDQSPLYQLKTKRKLAALFGISLGELLGLASRNDNYYVFEIDKENSKPRTVQVPKPQLERIHRRLFDLLTRIKPPEYLHSGVRGRSYITNAKTHVGLRKLAKLDIKKFFPSTKIWHVNEFFREVMKCNSDVADILTSLCTCNGHLPTGSCLSQVLAFYSHRHMFHRINEHAQVEGLTMTCYVDDITLSGDKASRAVLRQVRKIIKTRGLDCHKEHFYESKQPKVVTGVIVNEKGILLPNKRHKQIYEEYLKVQTTADPVEQMTLLTTLLGRVNAASQVDAKFTKKAESLTQRLRRLSATIEA